MLRATIHIYTVDELTEKARAVAIEEQQAIFRDCCHTEKSEDETLEFLRNSGCYFFIDGSTAYVDMLYPSGQPLALVLGDIRYPVEGGC